LLAGDTGCKWVQLDKGTTADTMLHMGGDGGGRWWQSTASRAAGGGGSKSRAECESEEQKVKWESGNSQLSAGVGISLGPRGSVATTGGHRRLTPLSREHGHHKVSGCVVGGVGPGPELLG
jgi:hypothetical protein